MISLPWAGLSAPFFQTVVASWICAMLKQKLYELGGGRADDVGPRRDVIQKSNILRGLREAPFGAHIPAIQLLVSSVDVPTLLEVCPNL